LPLTLHSSSEQLFAVALDAVKLTLWQSLPFELTAPHGHDSQMAFDNFVCVCASDHPACNRVHFILLGQRYRFALKFVDQTRGCAPSCFSAESFFIDVTPLCFEARPLLEPLPDARIKMLWERAYRPDFAPRRVPQEGTSTSSVHDFQRTLGALSAISHGSEAPAAEPSTTQVTNETIQQVNFTPSHDHSGEQQNHKENMGTSYPLMPSSPLTTDVPGQSSKGSTSKQAALAPERADRSSKEYPPDCAVQLPRQPEHCQADAHKKDDVAESQGPLAAGATTPTAPHHTGEEDQQRDHHLLQFLFAEALTLKGLCTAGCSFDGFDCALRALAKRRVLISSVIHPSNVFGGGLLSYAMLLSCGYELDPSHNKATMELMMSARFALDFPCGIAQRESGLTMQAVVLLDFLRLRYQLTVPGQRTSFAACARFLVTLRRIIETAKSRVPLTDLLCVLDHHLLPRARVSPQHLSASATTGSTASLEATCALRMSASQSQLQPDQQPSRVHAEPTYASEPTQLHPQQIAANQPHAVHAYRPALSGGLAQQSFVQHEAYILQEQVHYDYIQHKLLFTPRPMAPVLYPPVPLYPPPILRGFAGPMVVNPIAAGPVFNAPQQ
jgi:hypothetical protein